MTKQEATKIIEAAEAEIARLNSTRMAKAKRETLVRAQLREMRYAEKVIALGGRG